MPFGEITEKISGRSRIVIPDR